MQHLWWTDIKYAWRRLRRAPLFFLACAITLAISTAATTTISAVAYAVLFKPLPFANAERLVHIVQLTDTSSNGAMADRPRAGLTAEQLQVLQQHSRHLAAAGRWSAAYGDLTEVATPMRLSGVRISAELLQNLGVLPVAGRLLTHADEHPGAEPVIVLSQRTCSRNFGDPSTVVDREIVLNAVHYRVVGVLPDSFAFPALASTWLFHNSEGELDDRPEFWLPDEPLTYTRGGGFSLSPTLGVLKATATAEQLQAEVNSILPPLPNNTKVPLIVTSAQRELGRRLRPIIIVFATAAGFIFLISAVNVTNLLFSRSLHRERELAIRAALGGGRSAVLRDSITESVIIMLAGTGVGYCLATLCLAILQHAPSYVIPRARDLALSASVLAINTLVFTVLAMIIGGLAGLRFYRRADLNRSLRRTALESSGLGARPRLGPSVPLVVVELAVAIIALAVSTMVIGAFLRVIRVDLGFRPAGVLTFRMSIPTAHYPSSDAQRRLLEQIERTVSAVPGVAGVASSTQQLQASRINFDVLMVDGRSIENAAITVREVTNDYFTTLGVSIIAGRAFADGDRTFTSTATIVSRAFAQKYLAGSTAPGARVEFMRWKGLTVIGVAADTRTSPLDDPTPTMYVLQDASTRVANASVFVRTVDTQRTLSLVRSAVHNVDPNVIVFDTMTLSQLMSHATATYRVLKDIGLCCGIVSLALASVGLAGLLAHVVGVRRREIGIRLALGEQPQTLVATISLTGIKLASVGTVMGLVLAILISRQVSAALYGSDVPYARAVLTAAVIFISTAGLACYLPAKAATRLDPITVLRSE